MKDGLNHAVLIDLYSRRVVGWATSPDPDHRLSLAALNAALDARVPGAGLIHRTDRGCQYTCSAYRERLDAAGLVSSMIRKGNCWDYAVAESFFKTLRAELVRGHRFAIHQAAHRAVFEYIESFYNTHRLHSTIGYRSPAEAERGVQQKAA